MAGESLEIALDWDTNAPTSAYSMVIANALKSLRGPDRREGMMGSYVGPRAHEGDRYAVFVGHTREPEYSAPVCAGRSRLIVGIQEGDDENAPWHIGVAGQRQLPGELVVARHRSAKYYLHPLVAIRLLPGVAMRGFLGRIDTHPSHTTFSRAGTFGVDLKGKMSMDERLAGLNLRGLLRLTGGVMVVDRPGRALEVALQERAED